MPRTTAIPTYASGMRIWPGLVIRYTYKVGGNSHTYHLRALVETTLTAQVEFGLFDVLNPTTFAMNRQTAIASNPILQAGDKLILVDTGITIENTLNVALPYLNFITEKIHGGKRASIGFKTGTNLPQNYELRNGFQTQKPEGGAIGPIITTSFSLEILNAPDNFSGYVKVINKNNFENVRVTYPTVGLSSVPIVMTYPDGVTVTATYDTGNSYLNDPAENDFFYLKFERTTGNLIVTKTAINTIPSDI